MYSGPLSTLIVPDLPRHSMVMSKLQMTLSAGSEKSPSIPSPSRLKSSRTDAHAADSAEVRLPQTGRSCLPQRNPSFE